MQCVGASCTVAPMPLREVPPGTQTSVARHVEVPHVVVAGGAVAAGGDAGGEVAGGDAAGGGALV